MSLQTTFSIDIVFLRNVGKFRILKLRFIVIMMGGHFQSVCGRPRQCQISMLEEIIRKELIVVSDH